MTQIVTTTSAIEPHEQAIVVPAGADALLSQAVAAGASIDTLERLMALRKEMLAEKAKEAFNAAMAAFQAECPVIAKTKAVKTKSGAIAYKYAPIEGVVIQVKGLVQKHGFRYTTTMELGEGKVKAYCRVVHTLGHEEVSIMEVPLGNKTDIMSQSQVVAAASTFAKRYAFLNAFGIMTGDEDNDAAPSKDESITAHKAVKPASPTTIKPLAKLPPTPEVIMKFMKTCLTLQQLQVAYDKAFNDHLWNVDQGTLITECFLECFGKIQGWVRYGECFKDKDGKMVAKIARTKLGNFNVKASVVILEANDKPEDQYVADEDAALKSA